jgi:uncharacterized membrane protein (DUF373 family)
MSEDHTTTVTSYLNQAVTVLQSSLAFFLVVILFIGTLNLFATFVQAAQAFELLGYKNAIRIINTTIDIVLYLFIVVELFKTIVAYVESKSVVRAVIHAGLIAVVRQILIFKPADMENAEQALMLAIVYLVLLVALLLGFYLVHEIDTIEGGGH